MKNNSRVSNCFTDVSSIVLSNSDYQVVATGLAYHLRNDARLQNSYTRVGVRASGSVGNPSRAGGAAARLVQNVYIENVYTTGTATSAFSGQPGGLVGDSGITAGRMTGDAFRGTNYYIANVGMNGIGIVANANSACLATNCSHITLAGLRALSALPTGWSADDWDLRGSHQVPALKYGGGSSVCGDLCGQVIPNQAD